MSNSSSGGDVPVIVSSNFRCRLKSRVDFVTMMTLQAQTPEDNIVTFGGSTNPGGVDVALISSFT